MYALFYLKCCNITKVLANHDAHGIDGTVGTGNHSLKKRGAYNENFYHIYNKNENDT